MPEKKKIKFPAWIKLTVWILAAAGILIVTASAIGSGDKKVVRDVQVKISGETDHTFISKEKVFGLLEKAGAGSLQNRPVRSLDMNSLENELRAHPWIKNAELYVDNNNILRINVEQNEPVVRVFDVNGKSFYFSTDLDILPLSDLYTARVPVFTGFPVVKKEMSAADSTLAQSVVTVSEYLLSHSFWMSQIDEVTITQSGKFEMIPKLGEQVIRFGGADDTEAKFSKLLAFYKQVHSRTGWNLYSVIDVQYKGQVVAEKKDAAKIVADSLAAIRIMKTIVDDARKKSEDSTRVQMPERETNETPVITPREQGTPEVDFIQPANAADADNSQNIVTNSKNEKENAAPKQEPVKVQKEATPVKTEKQEVKKQEQATEKKEVKTEEKRVPKAVMPSKNNKSEQ
ncbi:MAG: hypothetical protein J5I50_02230 [Chitinophagaceae bacterium]|nr:hypothetical protein [Chitinophagaceae bacterium]